MSSSAMAENLRTASTVSSPTFIEVDRGLQVLVTENATHEPVIGRVFLQDERRGQVAKRMRRHPDADLFGDALDDLTAQGSLGLMPIRLAGKEPGAGYSGIAFGLGVVLHHGIGPISLPRVRRLLGSFPTALCPAQSPRALPAAPRDAPILQGKRPRLVLQQWCCLGPEWISGRVGGHERSRMAASCGIGDFRPSRGPFAASPLPGSYDHFGLRCRSRGPNRCQARLIVTSLLPNFPAASWTISSIRIFFLTFRAAASCEPIQRAIARSSGIRASLSMVGDLP